MKQLKYKTKGVIALALTVATLSFIVPRPAHAFWFIDDIGYYVIGKLFFGIGYVISVIGGIAVSVLTWILQIVSNINTDIVNSPPVQFGFPVTLAIANLFFVLGIIIIAIATILRFEEYGMKKVLWKLLVMAIAVNFGLIIAGSILNFSDQLSGYFLNGISPTNGNSALERLQSYNNFAKSLTGAFNPQKGFITSSGNPAPSPSSTSEAFQAVGESLGSLIAPITSLAFVLFSLIFLIIALAALVVMLIIRYVYLGFLLIILPAAWALWPFKLLSGNFHKWWEKFIKWTFFHPLVLFFLWLTIKTSEQMSKADSYHFDKYMQANDVYGAIQNFGGGLLSPVVSQLMQTSILLGIMLGGLFFAHSMSIKFADTATKAAMAGAKGFGKSTWTKGSGKIARAIAGTPGQAGPTQHASGWRRVFNPLNRLGYKIAAPLRAGISRVPGGGAALRGLQTYGAFAAASPGVMKSIYRGIKEGSGLFKKGKDWQCQICQYTLKDVKTKPTIDCPNCGSDAAAAAWKEVKAAAPPPAAPPAGTPAPAGGGGGGHP